MIKNETSLFSEARKEFHAALLDTMLTVSKAGIPSNADKDNKTSVALAKGIFNRLGAETIGVRLAGQTSGREFETICEGFLKRTFSQLGHLRPGIWNIKCVGSRNRREIARI